MTIPKFVLVLLAVTIAIFLGSALFGTGDYAERLGAKAITGAIFGGILGVVAIGVGRWRAAQRRKEEKLEAERRRTIGYGG